MTRRVSYLLFWLAFAMPLLAQTTVGPTTYSSGTATVIDPHTIQTSSTVTVSSSATVMFEAGESITLLPGFTAHAGSAFTAIIGTGFVPTTPAVSLGDVLPGSVDLSWSASTDPIWVVGYHIYRDGTLIGSTSLLTFTDSGVLPGTAYDYTVTAYDAASVVSSLSSDVLVTTPPQSGSSNATQLKVFLPDL